MSDKTKNLLFLIILFLLLALMGWHDVTTSNQAGLKNVDRSGAHLFIFLAFAYHLVYNIWHNQRMLYGNSLTRILYCIIGWMFVIDFVNGAPMSTMGSMLLMAGWWLLSYKFAYSYCSYNEDHIDKFVLVFLGMSIIWTLLNLYARTQIMLNFGRDNAVTLYAYFNLIFLPFVLLIKNPKLRIPLLIMTIFMVMTSFKRGTMMALPLMLMAYGYTKASMEGKFSKFWSYIFLIGIIAIIALPMLDEFSNGFLTQRFSREQMEDGSGRNELRNIALMAISQRDLITWLIGTGHGSSVALLGTGVHNEWVEFLFSFGVIGVILFFILGIILIRQTYFFYKNGCTYAPHMSMLIVYYFIVTMVSGFMGVYVTYYFFIFWGIATYLNCRELEARDFYLENLEYEVS